MPCHCVAWSLRAPRNTPSTDPYSRPNPMPGTDPRDTFPLMARDRCRHGQGYQTLIPEGIGGDVGTCGHPGLLLSPTREGPVSRESDRRAARSVSASGNVGPACARRVPAVAPPPLKRGKRGVGWSRTRSSQLGVARVDHPPPFFSFGDVHASKM